MHNDETDRLEGHLKTRISLSHNRMAKYLQKFMNNEEMHVQLSPQKIKPINDVLPAWSRSRLVSQSLSTLDD
jgi:hypothetical protein